MLQVKHGIKSLPAILMKHLTNLGHPHVPRTTRKTLAARSFSVKGPELWSRIPTKIRKQKALNIFKSNFKTYPFNKYLKN